MARDISLGPVANPDGTPSQTTIDMLAGTGRDPWEFLGWLTFSGQVRALDAHGAVERLLVVLNEEYRRPDMSPWEAQPIDMPSPVDGEYGLWHAAVHFRDPDGACTRALVHRDCPLGHEWTGAPSNLPFHKGTR